MATSLSLLRDATVQGVDLFFGESVEKLFCRAHGIGGKAVLGRRVSARHVGAQMIFAPLGGEIGQASTESFMI